MNIKNAVISGEQRSGIAFFLLLLIFPILFYCMFIFATILYSETFNTPKGVALQIPLYQNNDNLIVILILTTSIRPSVIKWFSLISCAVVTLNSGHLFRDWILANGFGCRWQTDHQILFLTFIFNIFCCWMMALWSHYQSHLKTALPMGFLCF